MHIDTTNDDVIMDDGTRYSANGGVIGLSPSLEIYEGYDGGFDDYGNKLTLEHRKELAAYMVLQWARVLNGEI